MKASLDANAGDPRSAVAVGWVLATALGFALLFGAAGALLGWELQLLLVSLVVPAFALLADYRLGIALLVLLLPFAASPLIPKVGPLSALNLLLVGVILVFALHRLLLRLSNVRHELPLPRVLLLCFFVPVTVAVAIGYPHLDEIRFLTEIDGLMRRVGFKEYVVAYYVKQMLLVALAVVIGASVIEYKGGRFLIGVALVSGALFVVAIAALIGSSGYSAARDWLNVLGRQNNEAGVMLLSVFGPLLFMREMVARPGARLLLTAGATLLAAGVLLTASRGAILGMLVIVAMYVVHFRRLRAAFFAATALACALALAPDAVHERLVRGLGGESRAASIADRDNPLTSGRVNIWMQLAPEVAKSPLIGSGMMSTRWAAYTNSGAYFANHPHNLYLEILMDLGIGGAVLMFVFYRWVWRMFRGLGRDARVPDGVRGFFAGSAAGFVGMLVYGVSNGHYYPAPEQAFFWIAIGLGIGYARLFPAAGAVATRRAPAYSPSGLPLARQKSDG